MYAVGTIASYVLYQEDFNQRKTAGFFVIQSFLPNQTRNDFNYGKRRERDPTLIAENIDQQSHMNLILKTYSKERSSTYRIGWVNVAAA